MLGFFPEAYPDELFYSICARYQEQMNYSSQIAVVQDLFQTKNATAIFDLPSRLQKLIAALPYGHSYTVDQFIDNHTLLPFYSPFLPLERLQLIREEMAGDNGSKIHTRLGIVAGFIEMPYYLRFCPVCMENDQKHFGECYWHRLHQLSGVEVCPTHEVFLEKSSVLTHNRRRISEFFLLEKKTQTVSPRPVDSSNMTHKILLRIARDIEWLLNYCRIVPGLEALYEKYLCLVKNNLKLVTYKGRIRIQELLKIFKNSYPAKILDLLQCPLDEKIRDNWLAQLVRYPQRVHHPLRHLLLIQFFGYTVQEFLELQQIYKPFGDAPWPCLNPVCESFKQPKINECQITYNQENYKPSATFSCTCGFVYSRTGSDKLPEDQFRFSKIKVYGSAWEESLKNFWEDPLLTLKEISEHLGVRVKTVLRQADRLNLTFPRPNTMARATELCPSLKRRVILPTLPPANISEDYRQQWLNVMVTNPGAGRTQLRSKIPAAYGHLYKYDREWLKEHLPPLQTNNGTPAVDWNSRDLETVAAVKVVVQQLKQDGERPIWITKTAIANFLDHPASAWVKRHLQKLPLTKKLLVELAETREEFAVRRVLWAANMFRQEDVCPQRWQLVRRAGLNAKTRELPLVKDAIHSALESCANLLYFQKR
ncbi:TnsD family Tn7-like transposition protein [Nostoc sp. FACHB-280]|uniref:TnsD family Tn7-like transposition protein n=1 Tax=Nostoc sp. FACHB-280 TaxID=2692839 RepID=UPI00168B54AC|nr:TnsD family Tn7-like transposition protein [Nostoc sp. FACHB-280]MBD2498894.1 TniQ family protein [Nostoc sp. FACHB-280]